MINESRYAILNWESEARNEIDRICLEFRSQLAAVRKKVANHTGDVDAFLFSTALFDGPMPVTVRADAFAESVRMFGSRGDLLRSVSLPIDSAVCEIGVWKGGFSQQLLKHFHPAVLHLFDLRFDLLDPSVRSHPSVVLHEGDSGQSIASIPDSCIDFAYVDGDHGYTGSRRDFMGILPKIKSGGFIQANDYTPWSVLSGFPYGVMANVNDLLNQGAVEVVGFGWHPFGHHDVLMRKR